MSTSRNALPRKANTYVIYKNDESFHIESAVMQYCEIGQLRRQNISFSPPQAVMYRLVIQLNFKYPTPAGTYEFEADSPASASISEQKKVGNVWASRVVSAKSGSVVLTTADPVAKEMEGTFEFVVDLYEDNPPLKFSGNFHFDASSCVWGTPPN